MDGNLQRYRIMPVVFYCKLKENQALYICTFKYAFRNIVPDNLFSATFSQAQTKYSTEYVQRVANNETIKVEMLKKTIENVNGANLLGIYILENVQSNTKLEQYS